MPIAITTINGYPAPFAQRYALYRAAGIDRILLWWGGCSAWQNASVCAWRRRMRVCPGMSPACRIPSTPLP